MAKTRFELHGSVAVVTGAASGIGAALAQSLAARGCALALADRNAAGLVEVAAQARLRGVVVTEHALDVADKEAVAALPAAVLAAHGRVNVVVNNAGVALVGRFDQVSLSDFEWLFNINFWGTVWMTSAFLPVLAKEPAAQLVNVSSVYGLIAPPGETHYSASKFAVRGFSEALRHELDGSPVGVTVVYPGGIRTAVAKNARKSQAIGEAELKASLAAFELLTRTEPETAAEAITAGIMARSKRVLIGKDANQIAALVRLFPLGYWPIIRRLTVHAIRRAQAERARARQTVPT